MLVTLSGIVIEINEAQQANALSPMLVMLAGIVTEVRDLQAENAPTAMKRVDSFIA
jgi:hypothetical protein